MAYVDSCIFIYAALYSDSNGKSARSFLEKATQKNIEIFTSSLTFDEVMWKVKNHTSLDEAISVGKAMLNMPNLMIIDVSAKIISDSLELMEKYKLHPRDAIHTACALNSSIFTIISEDKDFDKVKGIKRIGIKSL